MIERHRDIVLRITSKGYVKRQRNESRIPNETSHKSNGPP